MLAGLAVAGAANGTAVEESGLDDFLRVISNEDKPKFAKLVAVLKQMKDVTVFKVCGEPEKVVFVLGTAADGQVVGVRASVVETEPTLQTDP